MSLFNNRCTRCGLTVGRAMLGALARDMGGSSSFDPLMCDGKEHDFKGKERNFKLLSSPELTGKTGMIIIDDLEKK